MSSVNFHLGSNFSGFYKRAYQDLTLCFVKYKIYHSFGTQISLFPPPHPLYHFLPVVHIFSFSTHLSPHNDFPQTIVLKSNPTVFFILFYTE